MDESGEIPKPNDDSISEQGLSERYPIPPGYTKPRQSKQGPPGPMGDMNAFFKNLDKKPDSDTKEKDILSGIDDATAPSIESNSVKPSEDSHSS